MHSDWHIFVCCEVTAEPFPYYGTWRSNGEVSKPATVHTGRDGVTGHEENVFRQATAPSFKGRNIKITPKINMVSTWKRVNLCAKWTSFVCDYSCNLSMATVLLYAPSKSCPAKQNLNHPTNQADEVLKSWSSVRGLHLHEIRRESFKEKVVFTLSWNRNRKF